MRLKFQEKFNKEKEEYMKKAMAVLSVMVLFSACNDGLNNERGPTVNGKNERVDRSQRTVIDGAKYVDFTSKETNAAKYTKQDILFELNNTFRIKGGNSYITVDRKEGTLTISSDDAQYQGTGGHNMYARYLFDVQAASGDCLYLKMDGKKKGRLIIDNETMENHQMPDLPVCLPLYGYSRNRIEVSPVMEGYILMPSGTYWADRK
jgi:hypothetical protein